MTVILFSLVLIGSIFSINAWAQPASTIPQDLSPYFDAEGEATALTQSFYGEASEVLQQLPEPTKSIFGNQQMRVEVARGDGTTQVFGITTSSERVQRITSFPPSNPTLVVKTDEATLQGIVTSEDPVQEFSQGVVGKKITYTSTDAGTNANLFVLDIFAWLKIIVDAFAHFLGI